MLRLPVCLFLISRTLSITSYNQLVADVGTTLAECLDVIGAGWDYVGRVESLNEQRRRAEKENGNVSTRVKVGACVSILSAVDTYRDNHSKLLGFQRWMQWQEIEILNDFLKPVSKKVGELLYVASKDGDLAKDFHNACDGKGPNVVIVESEGGAVFGGYTNLDWGGSTGWKTSGTSFLFRLRPTAMKYPLKAGKEHQTVMINPHYGPVFSDLWIFYGALNSSRNQVGANSYSFTGYEISDGEHNFKIKEYAVLKAISK